VSKYLISFVTLLLLAASVPAAEVYRWVDEQGKVHYGEHPPPGVKDASRVKVQPPATAASDATTAAADAPATAAADPADPAANQDAVAQEAVALRQQRCNTAREQLKKYDEARFMVTKDDAGQQRRATLEEEAAERLRVKREIEQNCGG
jgi:hypothetical protein